MEDLSLETPEKFWVWPVTYSRGFRRLHRPEAKDLFSWNCEAHAARDEIMRGR